MSIKSICISKWVTGLSHYKNIITVLLNNTQIQIRTIKSRKFLRKFTDDAIFTINCSPKGAHLVTTNRTKVQLWSYIHKIYVKNIFPSEVRCIAYSPKGTYIGIGQKDGRIRICDQNLRFMKKTFEHDDTVLCMSFSNDETLLASGSSDCSIRVWNIADQVQIIQRIHKYSITSVCYSPIDNQIVYVTLPTIYICDFQENKRKAINHQNCSVARYSSNGKYLMSSVNLQLKIWDAETLQKIEPKLKGVANLFMSTAQNGYVIIAGRNRIKVKQFPYLF